MFESEEDPDRREHQCMGREISSVQGETEDRSEAEVGVPPRGLPSDYDNADVGASSPRVAEEVSSRSRRGAKAVTYPPEEWKAAIPEPPRMETKQLTDSQFGYTWVPVWGDRRDRWRTVVPATKFTSPVQLELSWDRLLTSYGPVRDTTP
jgi:hypothetical protein